MGVGYAWDRDQRWKDPLRIMILWISGGAEGVFEEMAAYRQTVTGTPDLQMMTAILARNDCIRVCPQIPFRSTS